MPISQGSVTRSPDTSGDPIKTYLDDSLHIQAVIPVDDSGSPIGITSNPFRMKGADTGHMALVPNTSDSEQVITVSTTTQMIGTLHANTTHVMISCSGMVRYSFITPPTSSQGHFMGNESQGIWHVTAATSASFIRDSEATEDAKIYVTPLMWS